MESDSAETEDSTLDVDVSTVQENDIEESESPQKEPLKELGETAPQKKFLRLPLARVKNMMKLDPDCSLISQDSLFLVTKATEMFIEFLAVQAGKNLAHGKRKTVMKKDVDAVIENIPNLCFLDGALD